MFLLLEKNKRKREKKNETDAVRRSEKEKENRTEEKKMTIYACNDLKKIEGRVHPAGIKSPDVFI